MSDSQINKLIHAVSMNRPLCMILTFLSTLAIASSRENISCNVMIVGAGPGGVHTAYQLSKLPGQDPNSNICVIEKENRLGGRLYDVALDKSQPDLLYGLGALRVMETQTYLRSLAGELGITLEYAPYQDDLTSARGYFAFSSEEIRKLAYPLVHDTEDALYNHLLTAPERQNAHSYPNVRSYMQAVIGPESYDFLRDISRFRAEFEVPLDVRSYLDYMDEEMKACCNAYYPIGGMSSFIRGMATRAKAAGVRFFVSEPAQTISKSFLNYEITTPHYVFFAKRLVIAADANSLKSIGGDVIDRIKSQKQFQDIFGIKVVTVAQKFPNSWWQNAGYPGKNIRRAWTTENCINALEIPINPYAAGQNVMRTVYDDDMRCVEFWENTYKRLGIKAVEAEIMRGLHYLFPNATIPEPIGTAFQIWPAAWYYLKAGTTFTNKEIATWAIEPIPGEDVSLVGDSYYIQRSGWSEAAYKSSINTLNAKFGFTLNAEKMFSKSQTTRPLRFQN